MNYGVYNLAAVALLALGISSCGNDNTTQTAATISEKPSEDSITLTAADSAGQISDSASSHIVDVSQSDAEENLKPEDIPYPLYPNGSSYRIGEEGTLHVILFQTEDSFEQVDTYYRERVKLPRLSAMGDYVRYSTSEADIDPWETSQPGIVIHKFNNESEREAVGADKSANTNIIMSFE